MRECVSERVSELLSLRVVVRGANSIPESVSVRNEVPRDGKEGIEKTF